jgi:hypothetical protein
LWPDMVHSLSPGQSAERMPQIARDLSHYHSLASYPFGRDGRVDNRTRAAREWNHHRLAVMRVFIDLARTMADVDGR